jgi:putative FmdB family regulatory protein
MPIYEYACRGCDHTFEALVQSADEAVECPACHGEKLERLMSVPARPPAAAGLPVACDPNLPPCQRPDCCRL